MAPKRIQTVFQYSEYRKGLGWLLYVQLLRFEIKMSFMELLFGNSSWEGWRLAEEGDQMQEYIQFLSFEDTFRCLVVIICAQQAISE